MNHRNLALCSLVLLLSTAPLAAQESDVFDVMMALGSHEAFEVGDDGGYLVAASGDHRRVLSVDTKRKTAKLETIRGPLVVPLATLGEMDAKELDELTALVDRAPAFPAEGETRFDVSALLGPHIAGGDFVVTAGGTLRSSASKEPPVPDIAPAVSALVTELDGGGLDEAVHRSIVGVLEGLDAAPGHPGEGADPRLLRRLVSDGWLARHAGDDAATAAVVAAVRRSSELTAVRVYEGSTAGEAVRVERLENAFGHRVDIRRDAAGTRYAVRPPEPFYFPRSPELTVVVDCPPGVTPTAGRFEWVRASLVHAGVVIATCGADGSFESDEAAWRNAFPPPRAPTVDRRMMPPHVPVVSPRGDVVAVVTPHGRLDPVNAGAADLGAEAERFLAQAASVLPGAAYMDLIGEYLFAYVYDSPDPRSPTLIGSEEVHGEIHQTVLQTLSTAAGGLCRGDCDDIAELYQEVARRQGKLAHIINIPAHNATAWGEKDGEKWRVHVVHTGPPLVFESDELPDALEACYGHFGVLESFDPERLDVAIRFSGENTRSRWILGWRIFAEPAYSEAMIDVQRDWHFHTYHRAIDKMEKMVAAGDTDSANFRELAGLFERTGQWDRAVEFNAKARASSKDSSLALRLNELAALHEAGRDEEFERLARKVVGEELPKRRESPAFPTIVLQLVATIALDRDMTSFAMRTLRENLGRGLSYQIANLAFELEDADPRLLQAPQVRQILDLIRNYATISVGLLDEVAKHEELADDAEARATFLDVETWLRGIALSTADTDPMRLGLYAIAGTFYSTFLGVDELDRRLAAAQFPKSAKHDHAARASTVLQLPRDLPWIKVSAGYWSGRLAELFDEENDAVDPAAVKRFHAAAVAARAAAESIGLAVDPQNTAVHRCALYEALISKNEAMLRARFRHAERLGDKWVLDSTARIVGSTASRLDPAWFGRVLEIWGEEVHHKPSWFAIAWEAATVEAKADALLAAEAGVAAHPDEEAFAEELEFMRQLFGRSE